MPAIPIQTCVFTDAALTPASAAAAAGDTIAIAPGDRVVLEVTNGGGASITVTIAPAAATTTLKGVGAVTIPSRAVAVPAGASRRIGPIPQGYVADGVANVSYSATASVTRAAFRIPEPA
jgi:hypothetical protein